MMESAPVPVSSRFVGTVALVASLGFGLLAVSVWLICVMLVGSGVVPLMFVERIRSRRRVVLSAVAGGVVGVVLVYLMRSHGMKIC
jgi:hypothetical protein